MVKKGINYKLRELNVSGIIRNYFLELDRLISKEFSLIAQGVKKRYGTGKKVFLPR
jgi:hypothetical protein